MDMRRQACKGEGGPYLYSATMNATRRKRREGSGLLLQVKRMLVKIERMGFALDERMIIKGAVKGAIINHVQKPFLCLGSLACNSSRSWDNEASPLCSEGGYLREI